ncbi:RHS repeat-associated core domain-containing protein [Curtobacterium sp. 24E2]|nr:hypothetical protein JN350_09295 [Curtobacterium sp. 24E2]
MITSRNIAGTGTASVISDPSTGQPLDLQTTDGTTSMWVFDGTGSPAAAIADTGKTAYTVSYDPYGVESITADSASSAQWQQNPYGFKGGLRSSSTDNGLRKFGYRWQSNVTGGWIERDTLDAPLSPTNANRYAYAGADPANSADPTGMVNCFAQPLTAAAAVPAAGSIGNSALNWMKEGAFVVGSGVSVGFAAGSAVGGAYIYLAKVDDCLSGGKPSNVYVGSNNGNAASPGY